MKKTLDNSAGDDSRTVIQGTTRRALLWTTAKLIASIAAALLAAVCLDCLLSKF
jgi:hypothetical protein